MGVKLKAENIPEAFFIKNRNGHSNTPNKQKLVVKFNSKKTKEQLMNVKPKLKENIEIQKAII